MADSEEETLSLQGASVAGLNDIVRRVAAAEMAADEGARASIHISEDGATLSFGELVPWKSRACPTGSRKIHRSIFGLSNDISNVDAAIG